MTSAVTRYAPIEVELQAMVYATRKYHIFLADTTFELFTDHRPLINISNKRKLNDVSNSRILRSFLKLMDYNFTVEYIPGSHNKAVHSFFCATWWIAQMKAAKHMLKCKPFSFECAAYHRLKGLISPFDLNVSEPQPKMT